MTFERGLLLNSSKSPIKSTIVTLKVHDRNRERLKCPDNLFFMAKPTNTQKRNMLKAD